jgi:SGNH hydrolase-like domain, acetyltransferase AlgX
MRSAPSLEVLSVTPSREIAKVGKAQVSASASRNGLLLQGWVVGDGAPVEQIEIVDGDRRLVARAPVSMPRPDLIGAHDDAAVIAKAGFRVRLEARGSGDGSLLLRAVPRGLPSRLFADIRVRMPALRSARRSRRSWSRRGGVTWSYVDRGISWSVTSLSGENEKVLVGREGWLFLRGDSNDVLGQHTGRVKLGRKERRSWGRILAKRGSIAKERGVIWLCVVIPDKEALYSEYLPADVNPVAQRPVHRVLELAEGSGAPVVYALANLQARKADGELYLRTDTHWSHRGAYVTYRTICDELVARGAVIDVLSEDSMTWSDGAHAGDLGSKLFPGPVAATARWAHLKTPKSKLIFDNQIPNHGRVLIYERPDFDGASCVVFGESFVENLLVFLRETFSRLVVVHTSMFVKEIVEQERPDVVLSLPLKRFLIRVPDDRDALRRLSETARGKGGVLPWEG